MWPGEARGEGGERRVGGKGKGGRHLGRGEHLQRAGNGPTLTVHLGDGLGRLLLVGEADEAEALRGALVVDHHLGARDVAKRREGLAQLLVVDHVVDVLHVQVDALELVRALELERLELLAQVALAVALLLRAADEERLALVLGAVERLDGGARLVVVLEVDEAEAARLALGVLHHDGGLDLAVALEERGERVVVDRLRQILDEDVGVRLVAAGVAAVLARHEEADEDLLAVEEHPVHLGHRERGGVLRLVVHEAVAARAALVVGRHLAREDVAEGGEGVVERLVVDRLVEVLDEDVARPRLAERRVAVAPHDAARLRLDQRVVHRLERALGVDDRVEVDVRVAERAARHRVAAHADRRDGADGVEELEEEGLGHLVVEVTDVEGSGGVCVHGYVFFSAAEGGDGEQKRRFPRARRRRRGVAGEGGAGRAAFEARRGGALLFFGGSFF